MNWINEHDEYQLRTLTEVIDRALTQFFVDGDTVKLHSAIVQVNQLDFYLSELHLRKVSLINGLHALRREVFRERDKKEKPAPVVVTDEQIDKIMSQL